MEGFTYYDRVSDLNAFISSFDVIVIPDDAGTGQKNRTLDAMRLGKCVVGLPPAFLGMPSAHPPYYSVVSSIDDVAPCVKNLLDTGAWGGIGERARQVFDERFNWESFRTQWVQLIESMRPLKIRVGIP